MYQKDFEGWNIEKQFLDTAQKKCSPRVGEVWTVKLGINIGCEENGKGAYMRPCVVLKKVGALYFVVPCTTKGKDNNFFYKKIESIIFTDGFGVPLSSYLLVGQGRTIDFKRCVKCKGELSDEEFYQTKKLLQGIYF